MSKPDSFIDIGSIVDHERQRLGRRQHSELTDTDFDLARWEVRILGTGRARSHLSPHLDAVLHSEIGHRRVLSWVSHHLDEPGGVSQIEKGNPTVITTALHPSCNNYLVTDVRLGDGPCTM
jgi:hypothetical protein